MQNFLEQLDALAQSYCEEMIGLVRDLIRAPSESEHEGDVARVLTEKLKSLGFDEVFSDKYGNVVGVCKGEGGGDNLLFNCHMDQVSTGSLEDWEHPPFSGDIADGYIHGRGASDTKGAMAPQIYGVYMLKKMGVRLKGDVILTFVIDEEPGDMWGMKMLAEEYLQHRKIALCVLGESTGLDVYLGHRGRAEIELHSRGRMSHSSAPWLGINAVDKMVKVLAEVAKLGGSMKEDPFLGKASQSVTHISCKPGYLSTVPDTCLVRIDRRYLPCESAEGVMEDIRAVVEKCAEADPEINVKVKLRETRHTSYTGLTGNDLMDKPAFVVPKDHPYVTKVVDSLRAIGQNPGFGKWNFGTDGAWTHYHLGIPTIGYSCCEEVYCHRPNDRVSIELMVKCAAGVASICAAVCGVEGQP